MILTLIALYTGVFLSALDATIVTSIYATIASDLNELSRISWIATGYLVSCAAFQPLYGRLSDIFGRKAMLLVSSACFGVGCTLCGLSYSLMPLIVGRVIAGIGGGGLLTVSTIAVSDLIPLRQRGIYQGVGNIAYGSGAAIGGALGGVLSEWIGWRGVFLIQVPFIVCSGTLVVFGMTDSNKNKKIEDPETADENTPVSPLTTSASDSDVANPLSGANPSILYGSVESENLPHSKPVVETGDETTWEKVKNIDFAGSALLVTSLSLLLFAISSASKSAWTEPIIYTPLIISVVTGVAFWKYELKCANPVIPVSLLYRQTIFASSLTNLFMTMGVFAMLYNVPLWYKSVLGDSDAKAGARLVGNFIGVSFGSMSSGIYMRKTGKYYNLGIGAGILTTIGVFALIPLSADTPAWLQYTMLFVPGAGYAAMLTVSLLALISAVSTEEQATATSIQYAFRGVGSTLGVSLSSTIFQAIISKWLPLKLYALVHNPTPKEVRLIEMTIAAVKESVTAIREAPSKFQPAIIASYDLAIKDVFFFATAMCAVSTICLYFVKEHELRQ
ncbi:Vacuolar membrane amino acid uptake transporter fnx2 [Yarrowia sp. C11]|nr:Vacuolar membrane amino acid uptake transporter fnx2 [Yarrowia sp. C11]KAG5370733.1 Vacuolar membrane amino acid uptake transporter fnx2 [Yarrowia sp. E02]